MQRHELAEIGHDIGNTIDHGLAGAVLHGLTIDLQPHAEVLRIGDLILRDEPWADRAEGVAGFAFRPLALALRLEGTLGHVVRDAVARDIVQRVGFRNIFCGLADDDAEFDFPVGLFGAAWNDDIVVRSDDGRRCLHEDDRLGRYGGARFRGVVREVETDADELARSGNTSADAIFGQNRKRGKIQRRNLLEAFRRNRVAANVLHMCGEIADFTFRVENGGLFVAGLTDAHQFHGSLPVVRQDDAYMNELFILVTP